ncbi:MAG: hypothetical protein AB7F86_10850 [Bdellovibrionales bacterium]
MNEEFVELRTTDNQVLYVRREAIGAFEVVTGSARVEGHVKLYIGCFKFLVQGDKDELLKKVAKKG